MKDSAYISVAWICETRYEYAEATEVTLSDRKPTQVVGLPQGIHILKTSRLIDTSNS